MSDRNAKLFGKVALITGAGGGIGGATAKLFTKLGATVSLLDVDETAMTDVAKECELLISHGQPKPLLSVGNVTNSDVCKKFVDDTVAKFSKIDILINNAGTTKATSLLGSSIEDYDAIFNLNVRAIVQLSKIAAPHLIKSKGSVVNIASVAGHRVVKERLFYGMSKAAVRYFTKYIAEELAQYQVRVNSISPGSAKTKIFLNYNITEEQLPQYYEQISKKYAMSRIAEPSEIAELLAFLCSNESTFMTGSDVVIDGGLMIASAF